MRRQPSENVGTVDDLHASATRLTGLTDFGADDYTRRPRRAAGVLRTPMQA